ncbi:MAG: urea ABC transporter permease subunit UrtB, partial [Pseudomonadota bacterium]
MFDGYTGSEIGAIFAMQGFSGLSLFCVFLLMALGLAIIFGQMGVINMAHGEFLTIGAYTTFLISSLTQESFPGFMDYYFFLAIAVAFVIAFIVGFL